MGIKLKGAKELKVKLSKCTDMGPVKQVVRKHTSELQQKAMRNAPVDTGALKRSIMLDISDGGMTGVVEPTVEYAPYVEWGTRYMSAQPFMKPAFDEQAPQFKSDLDRLMK